MIKIIEKSKLFYGDNLDILRKHIKDESIDLIYLDPPFNSKVNYNVIFKNKDKKDSPAQIQAFEDTWVWTSESEIVYDQLMSTKIGSVISGLREIVGTNDLLAYLVMMAIRLIELHRVLKNTGSLYLHCDPTASHYLKVVLDAIFGIDNFRNEIVWRRATSGQKGSQHETKKLGNNHDVILVYCKDVKHVKFFPPKKQLTQQEIDKKFKNIDKDGRRWKDDSAHIWRTPGMGKRPNLCYEWNGFKNHHTAGWRLSKENLQFEYEKGNFEIIKKPDGTRKLIRKVYLENYKGENIGDIWTDIDPAQGNERLGYPTQKPLSLLERIITTSSNKCDIILDPFCGCGTAVIAAEKLNHSWIGIDITHLAVSLTEKRVFDSFGIQPEIIGIPQLLEISYRTLHRTKTK